MRLSLCYSRLKKKAEGEAEVLRKKVNAAVLMLASESHTGALLNGALLQAREEALHQAQEEAEVISQEASTKATSITASVGDKVVASLMVFVEASRELLQQGKSKEQTQLMGAFEH